jgi:hypothetical protein
MECHVQISARKTHLPYKLCGFPQSFKANSGQCIQLGHGRILSHPFQLLFTNHPVIRRYTIIVMSKSNPSFTDYVSYILYALIWPHEWEPC